MSPLDEQVSAVIAMIHAAGGRASIAPDSPDYVKRAFLEMILSRPGYRDAIGGKPDDTAN
jgi:hypothetical protein